jgi:hypothetical protein
MVANPVHPQALRWKRHVDTGKTLRLVYCMRLEDRLAARVSSPVGPMLQRDDHAVVTPGAGATPAFDLQPRRGVTELLLPG